MRRIAFDRDVQRCPGPVDEEFGGVETRKWRWEEQVERRVRGRL
jgi:hypothetical protein